MSPALAFHIIRFLGSVAMIPDGKVCQIQIENTFYRCMYNVYTEEYSAPWIVMDIK